MMESIAMDADLSYSPEDGGGAGGDVAAELLARLHGSSREEDQHICAAVGVMSQALKEQGIPLNPVAYFGAATSSLERLSRDPSSATDPVAASLLSFLSFVLPRVPVAVVRSQGESVAETLVRMLGFSPLPVGAVKDGVKCVSYLLVVGEKVRWSSVSSLYMVLLGFITDPRPKVRKQSHSCLRDVLYSFQGSAILSPASEGIKSIFERFLLLAGGSEASYSTAEEGPRGAIGVLYIFNALKVCLPLMSSKSTDSILVCCKSLLVLQQSIVTRSIMEILQALCCSPTSNFHPEALLNLLDMLAKSVQEQERSADGLASIARLLHVGLIKACGQNKKMCKPKLPSVFNALAEILASEHEEAVRAATEALKGLINSCIDEDLVIEGVEQLGLNVGGIRRSQPAHIEKICATLEGLLGYRYNSVWDMSFQVLSAAFEKLGRSSSHLMAGIVKNLADMQTLPDGDFSSRKQLHECVGSAVGTMGPEIFLSLLPLNLEAEDLSNANIWLLPILKQHICGARLSFFLRHILGLAEGLQQKSQKLAQEGRTFSARTTEGLVYSLWSLLPAFCNYPSDTTSSFKDLQKKLCSTLRQDPDKRGIICSSLQILIRQNTGLLSENSLTPDDEFRYCERIAKSLYTPEVAEENLRTIRSFSSELFSVLSEIFLTSSKDDGGCLQSTIRAFAFISDKKVVKKFFTITMQKFLKATQEMIKAKEPKSSSSMQIDSESSETSVSHTRALLLDLGVSLLPGLDKEAIGVLFSAIKPAFQDKEGVIQKKAYKILSIILKEHDDFLSSNLEDLLGLMISSLPSCHFSAKRHRLDCLYFVIVYISKDSSEQRKSDVISSFLTEIVLALKEANKKTRNRAYDLLVEIGHACGDEERGGKKENLYQFFNMVAGGLAGETPHMISAAVKGLARLAYEFSDLIGAAYSLLPSAFLLIQRKNREVVKANLGLMKVLVAKSQADKLQIHLKGMVEGLMKWQDDTKNHFKAKVKLLLEMLVRKCGLDAVKAVMPEEHMKLLTNIRKIKERKERKAKSETDTESLHSKTTTSRQSRWNHTRIFSDYGDEDGDDASDAEYMEGNRSSGRRNKISSLSSSKAASLRSTRMRKLLKNLPGDLPDESEDPLDLLDHQRTRSSLHSNASVKRKPKFDDEPEIDPEGRLVVREGRGKSHKEKGHSDTNSDTRSQMSGGRSSEKSAAKSQRKRQKTTESGWAYTGSEYKNKRAGGDVKKKNKQEPYAYWPLDRKLLNRREERRAVARKGMSTVLKSTKNFRGKGASGALSVKGAKLKKRKEKGRRK